MTKKNSARLDKMLTETELELMNILWTNGEGTVNDALEALPKGRDLAYTSVSTILRILEQKGVLKARKDGRSHIYTPTVSKEDYESKAVGHLVQKVFDGTPSALVRRLIDSNDLSESELKELKKVLSARIKP